MAGVDGPLARLLAAKIVFLQFKIIGRRSRIGGMASRPDRRIRGRLNVARIIPLPRSAVLIDPDTLGPAVPLGLVPRLITHGGQDDAKQQKNKDDPVPPAAFLLGHRIADTAMNALAKVGGNRFMTELTTGQLNVGTRHRYQTQYVWNRRFSRHRPQNPEVPAAFSPDRSRHTLIWRFLLNKILFFGYFTPTVAIELQACLSAMMVYAKPAAWIQRRPTERRLNRPP